VDSAPDPVNPREAGDDDGPRGRWYTPGGSVHPGVAPPMDLVWLALAIGAGGCIALQAAANGSLRSAIGNPWHAAFFSICGTIVCACLFMLAVRPPLPPPAAVRGTPWWYWIGGPLGALIVLAGATLAPRLGAAAFIAAVVGGQLACSVLLDHFGAMCWWPVAKVHPRPLPTRKGQRPSTHPVARGRG